jgi:hypothetical protein
MSSKGGRRHIKHRQQDRPSLFFMIAIGVGLLFFVWIVVQVLRNRTDQKQTFGAAAISEAVRAA